MWRRWTSSGLTADLLVLQNTAERAGFALACAFSSSDEFETAVIQSRLRAGVYGPKRRRRHAFYAGAAAVVLAGLVWLA